MSRRRGRPLRDWIQLVEEIDALLRTDPLLSANEIQRRVGARRDAVLRLCKLLRPQEAPASSKCSPAFASPPSASETVPQSPQTRPEPVERCHDEVAHAPIDKSEPDRPANEPGEVRG